VKSELTLASMTRMAAACRSLTPSSSVASAAISRRARIARSSHTPKLFHHCHGEALPEFGIDLDGDGWSQGGQSRTEADAKIAFGWK